MTMTERTTWATVITFPVIGTGAVTAARGEQPEFEEGDVRDRQIALLGDARSYPVVAFGGLAAIKLRAYRTGV